MLAPGARPAHAYPFRNVGALPLTIETLRTSCGCTATLSDARVLPAGNSAAITIDCDPESSGGAQTHTVTVYSNDPAAPVRTLTLIDRQEVGLEADPPELYVGHLQRGQALVQPLQLRGGGISEAGTIVVSGKSIDAGRSDVSPANLRIAAKADAPLGSFTDRISVLSRITHQPLRSVPVTGTIDGPVTVSPARLHFGTVTPKTKSVRVVGVQMRGQQPLHISAVHLTPEIGAATVDTIRDGAEYRVTVTVDAGLRPGKLSAILAIDTDSPEQPHMQVPCIGRVVEKS